MKKPVEDLDQELMDFTKNMAENVNVKKKLNINFFICPPKRKKLLPLKALVVAAAVILISGITVLAFDPLKQFFSEQPYKGIYIAEKEGTLKTHLGSVEEKNINVEILFAIPETDNLYLNLCYAGINEHIEGSITKDFYIEDSDGNKYYESNNYSMFDYQSKHLENNNYIEQIYVSMKISKEMSLTLVIKNINSIEGEWRIPFVLSPMKMYVYNIDKMFALEDGYIHVNQVTITATKTLIDYTVSGYNMNNYFAKWYIEESYNYKGYTGADATKSDYYQLDEKNYYIHTIMEPIPYECDNLFFCIQTSIAPKSGIIGSIQIPLEIDKLNIIE